MQREEPEFWSPTPSWTPIDPRIYGPEKYREVAGLPDVTNAGTVLTVARIANPSGVVDVRRASRIRPPDSYCPYDGGLLEYKVANAALSLTRVAWMPLSPPYGGDPGPCP